MGGLRDGVGYRGVDENDGDSGGREVEIFG
jgi:hypothetical protein